MSWPAVTMRSPGTSPVTTSTLPSRRWPVSTFTRAALSSRILNTYCSVPCGTSACSGTIIASACSLGDEPHAREHAWPQHRVLIAHLRADHDRASGRIDQRIDRDDLAVELVLPGMASSVMVQRLPGLHLTQVRLRDAEIDLQRIDRFEVDEIRAFLHVVADRHRPQADDAGEGCPDVRLGELGLGELHRRLRHLERCSRLRPSPVRKCSCDWRGPRRGRTSPWPA